MDIKPQLNGCCNFIHVLPACSLRANGAKLNLVIGNGNVMGDMQHSWVMT
jgi:hypothetical protein